MPRPALRLPRGTRPSLLRTGRYVTAELRHRARFASKARRKAIRRQNNALRLSDTRARERLRQVCRVAQHGTAHSGTLAQHGTLRWHTTRRLTFSRPPPILSASPLRPPRSVLRFESSRRSSRRQPSASVQFTGSASLFAGNAGLLQGVTLSVPCFFLTTFSATCASANAFCRVSGVRFHP
jgi:hypothetical protein